MNKNKIVLFGDGTPLRQFMHAKDVANIIKAMIINDKFINMNIATEENYTIDKIAKIALKVCEAEDLKIEYDSSKPNGQMRKDIDTSKFKNNFSNLNLINLSEGIKEIFEKKKGNENG